MAKQHPSSLVVGLMVVLDSAIKLTMICVGIRGHMRAERHVDIFD